MMGREIAGIIKEVECARRGLKGSMRKNDWKNLRPIAEQVLSAMRIGDDSRKPPGCRYDRR